MKRIVHIVTHLGGGVGRALSSITAYEKENNSEYVHEIVLLDKPQNTFFYDICIQNKIKIYCGENNNKIEDILKRSDAIVLHWWHHPLMAKFLCEFPKIPIRLILWVHVSGCNYPMLPYEFVKKVEKVFVTTRYTFDNPYWNEEQRKDIRKKASLVYGMGEQLNKTQNEVVGLEDKESVNIGYLGTINDSKMHPDYFKYCRSVVNKIHSVHFTIVGGNEKEVQHLKEKAKAEGLEDKVRFTGYVTNTEDYFRNFDIFGYLLNPYHYGASENVILESLALGIPVVALNQGAEKYLIKNMYSGILVDDAAGYVNAINYIINNKAEMKRLINNGHKEISTEFSMKNNVDRMREGISSVISCSKKIYEFKDIFGEKPSDWFLSCLGEDKDIFMDSFILKDTQLLRRCKPIFREDNKSSVNHFWTYFKEDIKLNFWKDSIR